MIITFIIFFITLFGIIFGANNLVNGSCSIARRFKISDFIIGALIVGVGTSMPELVVSLMGTLQNNADIAIGNVVGSNIFNILGILGLTALIFPIPIQKKDNNFDIIFCIVVSVFLTLVMTLFSNGLNFYAGVILLILFGLYTWFSFIKNKDNNIISSNNLEPFWLSVLKIVGGLSILILSCEYFIKSSILLAKDFGLSESVISLTLIACGTSLPELAASIVAAFKKNTQLALGNIIGSNIFNITFILGLCSLFSPLNSIGIGIIDYYIMVGAALFVLLCALFGKINRFFGFTMLLSFIIYTLYLIF